MVPRFPDLHAQDGDETGLDHREAALAHAIVDQTVRRWLTLRHLLQGSLRQPFEELEPAVGAGLLAGATQIFLLERIPARAAINESVAWVKSRTNKGAAGLVNAVLRRMSELATDKILDSTDRLDPPRNVVCLGDGRARVLARAAFSAKPCSRLSQQYSVPMGLIERWRKAMGDDKAREQVAHVGARSPIVLNIECAQKPFEHDALREHDQNGHAVFGGSANILKRALEGRSDVWVQDAASGGSVRLAHDLRPSRVLDLCGGRGTKSRQMALMWPEAQIVATDKDPVRFEELERVALGFENLTTVAFDHVAGPFDLVLLDVPCTNTGVLARRREARYRFSDEGLGELVALQREILRRGWTLAGTGGRVLYATCSNEPEEGEEQASWAVSALGGVLERECRHWPAGLAGGLAAGYRDGSYAALIRRA